MRGSSLQRVRLAGGEQLDLSGGRACGTAGTDPLASQQASCLARYGFTVVHNLHIRPQQLLQIRPGKRVVGAAKHQRVHFSFFMTKYALSPYKSATGSYYFCSVLAFDAALYGIGQAVSCLYRKVGQPGLRVQQRLEFCAGQRAARGHHGDVSGFAQGHGGLQGGLYANDGHHRVLSP